MKPVRYHMIAALSLTLLFGAGLTIADGGKSEWAGHKVHQQNDGGEKTKPILSGPKVEEEAKAAAEVTRMGEQRRSARPHVPPMMWLRMARSLDLNESQVETIDELVDAQRKAMREFHEEHGEALRALQSGMREARQAQDRDRVQEVMGEIRALRAKGPQPHELQKAIWKLLTTEQQQSLRERIEQWREERAERMRERRGTDGRSAMDRGEGEDMERVIPRRPRLGVRPGSLRE